VATISSDGNRRALAFVTSAYSSYSSCRQYLEDIERALGAAGPGAPRIDKLRPFYNHPGFIGPFARATGAALEELGQRGGDAHLVFSAHSIPLAMAETSEYRRQLIQSSELVAGAVARSSGRDHPWRLVFQSRSGPPSVPWLEPDVNSALAELAGAGAQAAVIVPIGFVSDHLEVVYDLGVVALGTARRLGINAVRAATPGTDPEFVAMARELILERVEPTSARRALGPDGPRCDTCGEGCCPGPTATGRPGGATRGAGGRPG